ncbi:hypothetical protein [Microseira wollei]|uniref:hypothetical protein n=1 Tax=Microseira wollei TaxID=467598 RepID=UPI001CFD7451|nr:hypothetical protein [Microseira wollei]
MYDKHRITEEPCEGKLSSTVLESSGSREGVADFNRASRRLKQKRASRVDRRVSADFGIFPESERVATKVLNTDVNVLDVVPSGRAKKRHHSI